MTAAPQLKAVPGNPATNRSPTDQTGEEWRLRRELAARVAGDVARDLVPPERRPWLIGGALLAVAVIGLLLARACGS